MPKFPDTNEPESIIRAFERLGMKKGSDFLSAAFIRFLSYAFFDL